MKVIIYSNLDVRCGIAQYACDLGNELARFCSVVYISDERELLKQTADAVIFNWHPARLSVTAELARQVRCRGVKSILVLHNSFAHEAVLDTDDILLAVDRVVAHERLLGIPKASFIPFGIPVVEPLQEPEAHKIGTAGFPFLWKRFDVVAEAARNTGAKCLMIAPRSDMQETDDYMRGIAGHLGDLAEIHREWLSEETVVRMLSSCTANIFWFESRSPDDELGQSGSVRLGLAARRPIIISKHRKLRTLVEYAEDEGEIYVAECEQEVYEMLNQIFAAPAHAQVPSRIIDEQGWPQAALRYWNLIQEVAVC